MHKILKFLKRSPRLSWRILILILGIILLLITNANSKKNQFSTSATQTCRDGDENYSQELISCKNNLEKRLKLHQFTYTELENQKDKTKFKTSSKRCNKNIDIWEYLPDELRKRSYKKDVVPIGSATYDPYSLEWSYDCKYLPFVIELVGRGSEAYESKDYDARGLYIYNDLDKTVGDVFLFADSFMLDITEHGSNYWFSNKYIFVVTTDVRKNRIVKTRYEYNVNTDTLSLHEN
jgi:hypothetical protein